MSSPLSLVLPLLRANICASAIREYDAKLVLAYWLERAPAVHPSAKVVTPFVFPSPKVAQISWDPATNAITPDTQLPGWVFSTKLVAKPDQLIKRRGKAGLLALNKSWDEAKEWIQQRAGKPQKVSASSILPFALHLLASFGVPCYRRDRLPMRDASHSPLLPLCLLTLPTHVVACITTLRRVCERVHLTRGRAPRDSARPRSVCLPRRSSALSSTIPDSRSAPSCRGSHLILLDPCLVYSTL